MLTTKTKLSGLGELGLALEGGVSTRRRVYVTRDFYAIAADQLSVFVDDTRLEMVCDGADGGKWCLVRDRGTGREGNVPVDIVEEAGEREARFNAARNCTIVPEAGDHDVDRKRGREKGRKRAAFAKESPLEIPAPTSEPNVKPQVPTPAAYVEYDPQLEQQLRQLLVQSLDERPGQLIRVYAGPRLAPSGPPSAHYKTIRVDGDMTMQEMILAGGLKYAADHSSTASKLRLYMRHTSNGTTVPLEPRWRLWQVTELAKLLTVTSGADACWGRKAGKWYKKAGKRYGGGVEGLKRRSDLDFATRFQFVLDTDGAC